MSSPDELDDDYTKKKASYDNLPTFKREMMERYDTVIIIWFSLHWVVELGRYMRVHS